MNRLAASSAEDFVSANKMLEIWSLADDRIGKENKIVASKEVIYPDRVNIPELVNRVDLCSANVCSL